jgi:DNA-binding NarL/FixJ family response regulator
MKTRILLVDDHELVRRGIRSLLEAEDDFEVCAEAADGRQAIELVRELTPDVVVMDIGMPGLNGIDATRRIRKTDRRTEVLALSLHESEHFAREVLAAGARGYVFKSDAAHEVVQAVRSILRKKQYLTKRLAESAERLGLAEKKKSNASTGSRLTRREREVMQLVAEGHSSRSISEVLKISVKTTETHRARIMKKLELRSVADLVRYALREGIIVST